VPLAGGIAWRPTRQPVAIDLWEHALPAGDAYNTITTWSNKGKDIAYRGDTYYWTKDREFERLLDLPRRRPNVAFELAAGVSPDVRRRLLEHGWRQVSSVEVSRDVARYRTYIQSSRGEFTVARDQYVRPRTGWFSDRSACYLAAGRPVITQDTGFGKHLPTGRGLFAFTTLEDVVQAIEVVETDYAAACRAAHAIAAEYFDAERVLASLMARADL
jgi:hypothetical protein